MHTGMYLCMYTCMHTCMHEMYVCMYVCNTILIRSIQIGCWYRCNLQKPFRLMTRSPAAQFFAEKLQTRPWGATLVGAPNELTIGALIIKIGFWGVYYTINIIRNHQSGILVTIFGPYISVCRSFCVSCSGLWGLLGLTGVRPKDFGDYGGFGACLGFWLMCISSDSD